MGIGELLTERLGAGYIEKHYPLAQAQPENAETPHFLSQPQKKLTPFCPLPPPIATTQNATKNENLHIFRGRLFVRVPWGQSLEWVVGDGKGIRLGIERDG